jgi:hypothetical protein
MVPVGVRTADQLAEIAWVEGQTVSWVVRRCLADYAEGYLARLRGERHDGDSWPSSN